MDLPCELCITLFATHVFRCNLQQQCIYIVSHCTLRTNPQITKLAEPFSVHNATAKSNSNQKHKNRYMFVYIPNSKHKTITCLLLCLFTIFCLLILLLEYTFPFCSHRMRLWQVAVTMAQTDYLLSSNCQIPFKKQNKTSWLNIASPWFQVFRKGESKSELLRVTNDNNNLPDSEIGRARTQNSRHHSCPDLKET